MDTTAGFVALEPEPVLDDSKAIELDAGARSRGDGRRPLPARLRLFAYAVEPKAPVYRALVAIFAAAKANYVLRLRPEDALARLDAAHTGHGEHEESIEATLDQLVAWGNLKRTQDTARARNLADFLRRRSLYQLTAEGEAAHRAVTTVEAALGKRGSLQKVMLSAILDELRALVAELCTPSPDPAVLHTTLFDLFNQFSSLAANASVFMGALNEAIEAADLADDAFAAYKKAVIVYLDDFLSELNRLAPHIKEAIVAVEALGVEALAARAASADEAPTPEGTTDAAPEVLERWAGLRAWFVGAGGARPTIESLQGAARDAINRLLAILERLNERRYRRVNRAADLVQLGRWFARASDEEAHALFRTAFGLASARHLGMPCDDEAAAAGTSWWSAPAVEVPARLRSSGRTGRTGRTGAVEDNSAAKRALAARLQAERVRDENAAARFVDRGPFRLSALGVLGVDEFELLLDLLDRALSARSDASGRRVGRTRDGGLRIVLTSGDAAAEAEVLSPRGRLRLPDYTLEVTR